MPRSKLSFKKNRFEFEIEDCEFTVGPDQVTIGKFTGSVDIADLLHTPLPKLHTGGKGVRLVDYGLKKIQIIKEVRAATGFGLKEAKELTEQAPVFIPIADFGHNHTPADFARTLEEAGANAEVEMDESPPPQVIHILQTLLADVLTAKVSDETTEE